MNDPVVAAVDRWFQEAKGLLSRIPEQSIHINDLLAKPPKARPSPAKEVEVSLEAFTRLISVSEPFLQSLKPGLIIPLLFHDGARWSSEIEFELPVLNLIHREIGPEPPLLYLTDRDVDRHLYVQESYRMLISHKWFVDRPYHVHCEYVVMRPKRYIEANVREFQRSVQLWCYPLSLVPP
jgi:hypothetical protein